MSWLNRALVSAPLVLCLAAPSVAFRGGHETQPARPTPNSDAAGRGEELHALGYSAWSTSGVDLDKVGVTQHDRKLASPGYNLYTDYSDAVSLMDMDGRVVHTWRLPAGEGATREYARMLPDGSLLSLGKTLVKLAWNGSEQWRVSPKRGQTFTHDLDVLPDGSLIALSLDEEATYNGYPVKIESIEHLSSRDRSLKSSWSALGALQELHGFHPATAFDGEGNAGAREYHKSTGVRVDYYHANTLRALPDTPLGRKDPRFRKGNWLIGLRQVGLVAILDPDTKKVLWGWGPGTLDHPHSPVMLADGQILIFDNGMDRGYSRLIKMNPATGKVTWTYEGKPRSSFFTAERGYVQPLPNGNLLVTLSSNGQALELTPDGQVAWEFYHPDIQSGARRAIYRTVRYPAAMVERLLGAKPAAAPTPRPGP